MMNTQDNWVVGTFMVAIFLIIHYADSNINYNEGYVDGFYEGQNNCQLEELKDCKKDLTFCNEYSKLLSENEICIINPKEEIEKCKAYNRWGLLK